MILFVFFLFVVVCLFVCFASVFGCLLATPRKTSWASC